MQISFYLVGLNYIVCVCMCVCVSCSCREECSDICELLALLSCRHSLHGFGFLCVRWKEGALRRASFTDAWGQRWGAGGQGHAGQWGALYTHCFQEDLLGLRLFFGGRQGGQETKAKHFSWGSLWDSESEQPCSTSKRQWSWEENIPPSWKRPIWQKSREENHYLSWWL